MTNKMIIDRLAEKTGMTKKVSKEVVDALELVIKEVIGTLGSETVKVADLTFSVKEVEARKGRNPATGEEIDIPARKKLAIKQSADFKRAVNV